MKSERIARFTSCYIRSAKHKSGGVLELEIEDWGGGRAGSRSIVLCVKLDDISCARTHFNTFAKAEMVRTAREVRAATGLPGDWIASVAKGAVE